MGFRKYIVTERDKAADFLDFFARNRLALTRVARVLTRVIPTTLRRRNERKKPNLCLRLSGSPGFSDAGGTGDAGIFGCSEMETRILSERGQNHPRHPCHLRQNPTKKRKGIEQDWAFEMFILSLCRRFHPRQTRLFGTEPVPKAEKMAEIRQKLPQIHPCQWPTKTTGSTPRPEAGRPPHLTISLTRRPRRAIRAKTPASGTP
jgi:hypothetical protein